MNEAASRKAPSPDVPMASITPYGLRMPAHLKKTLEVAARQNGRSLNSEIVARLAASVQAGEGAPDFVAGDLAAQVEALALQLRELRAEVRALEARANMAG